MAESRSNPLSFLLPHGQSPPASASAQAFAQASTPSPLPSSQAPTPSPFPSPSAPSNEVSSIASLLKIFAGFLVLTYFITNPPPFWHSILITGGLIILVHVLIILAHVLHTGVEAVKKGTEVVKDEIELLKNTRTNGVTVQFSLLRGTAQIEFP